MSGSHFKAVADAALWSSMPLPMLSPLIVIDVYALIIKIF
jgi:hypothetical protein